LSPITDVVVDDFDRAVPHGVSYVKAAGNYASDLSYMKEMFLISEKINFFVEAFSPSARIFRGRSPTRA
jgi:hypothetical protein